ncbi:MAG TPA: hypothetical protein PLB59_12600 [Bacteroidales bacterium]|nr:hypothetical protein [Bacteroidales bacterium]HPI31406.1 hypothetical protein [Bacteroidales bacterium]HQN17432.1 hypothetical protein [Bacteroidales bacterium]HQP16793.1 hypothetical protein [Bacteroidales bacterium]
MKKHIIILAACFLFCGVLSSYAQFDKFKPGTVKTLEKPKPKTTKTEESDKTKTEQNSKEQTTTTNNKEQTTTTKPAATVDFKELEIKKMEWNSLFESLQRQVDKLTFEEYKAKKDEYLKFYSDFSAAYKKENGKEHSDTYTTKLIGQIDAFYTETVSPEKMASIKEKAKRSFDDKDWTVYPSDRINDIEVAEKMVASAKIYLTRTDPALEEFEKSLIEQKEKIKAYVAGGGLEKRDAEIEKKLIDERHLGVAGMTDASVNATVTSKIDKAKYGEPIRVVITSNTWEIEKNQYGVANLKFVRIDIATKKSDGSCYFLKGSVAQKHEGGGQYGPKYLNIFYTEGQINCNNVNK